MINATVNQLKLTQKKNSEQVIDSNYKLTQNHPIYQSEMDEDNWPICENQN